MTQKYDLNALTEIQKAIINVLQYFDFFNHSLYLAEIHRYLNIKTSQKELLNNLGEMTRSNLILNRDDLWALKNEAIDIRLNNLKRNSRLLRISKRMGWLISNFPFIKGVYLSGSLSKLGAKNDDDDIDYFIITEPNRTFTTKLLLGMFRRLFLFNSHKYFCPNYIIDEKHLELKIKNIYTAVESASLIALHNKGLLGKFYEKNPFIQDYFPNFIPEKAYTFNSSTFSRWRLYDLLFGTGNQQTNNFWGDWIENKVRKIIKRRHLKLSRNKYSSSEISEYGMGNWISNVQDRVIDNYSEKKLV